jgi:hypothetical protein
MTFFGLRKIMMISQFIHFSKEKQDYNRCLFRNVNNLAKKYHGIDLNIVINKFSQLITFKKLKKLKMRLKNYFSKRKDSLR